MYCTSGEMSCSLSICQNSCFSIGWELVTWLHCDIVIGWERVTWFYCRIDIGQCNEFVWRMLRSNHGKSMLHNSGGVIEQWYLVVSSELSNIACVRKYKVNMWFVVLRDVMKCAQLQYSLLNRSLAIKYFSYPVSSILRLKTSTFNSSTLFTSRVQCVPLIKPGPLLKSQWLPWKCTKNPWKVICLLFYLEISCSVI